jgi:monothiol glutaredoxin
MSDNPFNILGSEKVPEQGGQPVQEQNKAGDLNERIKSLITSADVFLFMKGIPEAPQCGFSANVCGMLNSFQAKYKTFDILTDTDIRQGVKDFSNWPTFPQLYVKGELLGGNDIITEMYHNGELAEVLKEA